jgi:hypothetical protein
MSRLIPIFLLIALLLSGCGGGSETTVQEPPAQPRAATEPGNRAYVAAANRICAEMTAKSRRMGARFARLPNPGIGALALTTRELVKPALPVLERSASRLRALEKKTNNLALESYVSLYDPIVAVVRSRVEAGEAGDPTRAHALELQMLDLGSLQRQLAREAGLRTCDVDFIQTFAAGGGAR